MEKEKRDVFRAFLVKNADYAGEIELPVFETVDAVPERIIPFSRAMARNCKDFSAWVMFYEHDEKFERLWNNPTQYLPKLKKFKGVITPDFSMYRSMPLVMQMWNTYRGRALAAWLCENGISLVPNVRFNDERTYAFCFDGIGRGKTVSVGTHGCLKSKADKEYFRKGLAELVERLQPHRILVYGAAPDGIFAPYKQKGIEIVVYESEFAESRRQVTA